MIAWVCKPLGSSADAPIDRGTIPFRFGAPIAISPTIRKEFIMAKFHDTLGGLNPEEGYPEDLKDQLTAAYDEDFAGAVAKTTQLEADVAAEKAAHEAEVARLKAANYDLVMQIPKETTATGVEDDVESTNADINIDDLFVTK